MQDVIRKCANCQEDRLSRHRDFNPQVWSLLLHWGEVQKRAVAKPICEPCYQDLRDILIDRADEMEELLLNGIQEPVAPVIEEVKKPVAVADKKTVSKKAAAPAARTAAKKTGKVAKIAS